VQAESTRCLAYLGVKRKFPTQSLLTGSPVSGKRKFKARYKARQTALKICRPVTETFATRCDCVVGLRGLELHARHSDAPSLRRRYSWAAHKPHSARLPLRSEMSGCAQGRVSHPLRPILEGAEARFTKHIKRLRTYPSCIYSRLCPKIPELSDFQASRAVRNAVGIGGGKLRPIACVTAP
jgi:hypothetical protein